jgi:glycosyltransferase involved in cell wall biosynthesis
MARLVVAKNTLPYPPTFGTDVVTFQLLRALATRHEITLVAAVTDESWRAHVGALEHMGIRLVAVPLPHRKSFVHRVAYKILNLARAMFTASPLELWYFNPPAFRAAVARAAREADLVQIEYWYLFPTARSVRGVPTALLKHDAEFNTNRRQMEMAPNPVSRWGARVRWLRRRKFEQEACRLFDHVLCLSPVDASLVAPFCRRPPEVVFPLVPLPPEDRRCQGFSSTTLLYFGNMGRGANLQGLLRFVQHIYPRIRAAVPHVRLILRGDPPPPALRRAVGDDPSVTFQPFGHDLEDVLAGCAATIVPLWVGSGIKIKILTALSYGVPVVTTPVGAEGIGAESGHELLVAASDEEFATATIAVLLQQDTWQTLADGGREFARRTTAPDMRAPQVVALYESLARRVTTPTA